MSDLISRDVLIRDITEKIDISKAERAAAIKHGRYNDVYFYSGEICIARRIRRYVNMFAPTVDAVPVVHAENVTPTHYSDEFLCGNCGFCCEITEIRHDDEDDFGLGGASVYEYECKFCPDCGAKIDGGDA